MKANKKAILGMLVAMIMSLGIMGGFNATTIEKDDITLSSQQAWGLMMNRSEMTIGEADAALIYGTALSTSIGIINPPLGVLFGL